MDLIIVRQDGTEYKASENNMKILKFEKGFPRMKTDDEGYEDSDGFEDYGAFYVDRPLSATILYTARDRLDNPLIQNKIFRIFDSREWFYLIDDREPNKRWIAKCSNDFTPDQRQATFGTFDISFVAQPYAESAGTTADPMTFESGLWGIGMGLVSDDSIKYTHDTVSFEIYNAGDVVIDPRKYDIDIVFKGASNGLKIKNVTTGDEWTYTGTTVATDEIKLSGIRSYKNGLSIFRETNRKLLKLNRGYNDFTVSGAIGSFTISFIFRFRYL